MEERAEIRGQRSEATPESACDFVPQGTGGELVMQRDRPEFSIGAVGRSLGRVAGETSPGTPTTGEADAGTPAGVRGIWDAATGGVASLDHRLPAGKPSASLNRRFPQGGEPAETSESTCDFDSQSAGGELIRAQDCPEILEGGVNAVEGSTLLTDFDGAMPCAFLDPDPSSVAVLRQSSAVAPLRRMERVDLTHDLDRFERPETGTKRYPAVCRRPVSKAVPMHRDRSPSPGGTVERLGTNGPCWGLRRWAIEAGRGLVGMREMPYSLHESRTREVRANLRRET